MGKNITFFKIGILFLILGLHCQSFAQSVNATATVSWAFNSGTANQLPTYGSGTESYFKPALVTLASNYVYNGTTTPNASTVTADPTLVGVVFTNIKCALASGNSPVGAVAENLLAYSVTPVTGLDFKPSSISFNCLRFGTGSGLIDLYWKSNDGTTTTSTLIQANIKPARDGAIVAGDNTTSVNIDLASLALPTSTKECTLEVYIHSLGSGKSVGLSNIKINGTIKGSVAAVTTYTLTASAVPETGGSVSNLPVGSIHDAGTSITVTAAKNFGYAFSHWENPAGQQISTDNPYTFAIAADTSLKAVFNVRNTYALNLTVNGGKEYMVTATPAGTEVGAVMKYEEGTNVLIKASANPIMSFSNWGTGETTSELSVVMNQDKTVNAVFSVVDYVVGWDFYKTGSSGRVADFASKTDNTASALVLRKADGTNTSWLGKSVSEGGNYGRGSAVNWRLIDDKYYYQISFNATDFINMSVRAGMLFNYVAYSVQNVEYSLDGTNFTPIGTYTLTTPQVWNDQTFNLPADANNAPLVYIRWIPDYTSPRIGAGTTNDGTSISDIYVLGSQAIVNDGVAPVLTASIPANGAATASTSGNIVLNFDEKIQITAAVTAMLGSKTLTPVVFGKTISFPYTGLDYNTNYTFTLAGGVVSDLSGNTLTTPVSFSFTTLNKPVVTKKKYDFIVGVNGDFAAAKAAAQANASTGERFFIFFPDGEYDLGNTTGDATQQTSIGIPNVSYIGQSADGVILFNKPLAANEGIGTTPTINFLSSSTNIYMQDITLLNKMDYRTGTFTGRAVALRDQGDRNIYKNVKLLSNQDTYYTGNNRYYLETSEIHGTVDFIFGGGDVFFNECTMYLEDRSGNVVTANASSADRNWGYVFSNCTIDGFGVNNSSYRLGRPWNGQPKVAYINTKMKVLPTANGWGDPMNVVPYRFAEYNSQTATGGIVDLSNRRTSYTKDATTVVLNPVFTETQALTYTIENVLGGNDGWQPKLYTDQAAKPNNVVLNGTTLAWDNNNYVLGWAVFKDGLFVDFVTTNSYQIPAATVSGKYTVRAANSMGGLGSASNEITISCPDVSASPIVTAANTSQIAVGTTLQLSHPIAGGTWTSSATATATIDANGLLTALASGTTTITYTLCTNSITKQIVVAAVESDSDNDGVPDSKDLCPNTTSGGVVDANGCFTLASDNFSIEVIGESCKDKKNGKIIIAAKKALNYTTVINGVPHNFTTAKTIENVTPGMYDFCIAVASESYSQCFNVAVESGTNITAKTAMVSDKLSVDIEKGTAPYTVLLNGKNVLETTAASFSIDVNPGDLVQVQTAIACEGTINSKIDNALLVAYPNPTTAAFDIDIPLGLDNVKVDLLDVKSQLISSDSYKVTDGKVQMNLESNPVGIYFVRVYLSEEPAVFRIIKK
ncbi:pectinesterase family protein [Flavobacterium sp. ST-87]|uniref:Pectinesterase family protein n=1 Tax=Flavobacterium plantiphilum TaxID=3163297 RepID=A0ABW8XRX7_9FLAO